MWRIVPGNMVPFERIINKTGINDRSAKYRLDIIVENKSDLLTALREELQKRFDIKARPMQEIKDVYVLQIADAAKSNNIPRNSNGKRTYFSRHGDIDQQGITMDDLAGYLENYGTGNLFVIDETNNKQKFDIKFSFQPENPQSLTDILTSMGLRLRKEKRKVDMLMLYRDNPASL
jgi:uncharacterized protein (TIGR03435 family)